MKYFIPIILLIAVAITQQQTHAADEWDPSVLQHAVKDPVPAQLTYTQINYNAMEPQTLRGWFCIVVPELFTPDDINNAYFLYTSQNYVFIPITHEQFEKLLNCPLQAREYYLPAQVDVISNQRGVLEYSNLKLLPCKLDMAKIRQTVRADFEKRLDASHDALENKLQAHRPDSDEKPSYILQKGYQDNEIVHLLNDNIAVQSIIVQNSIPQWQLQQIDEKVMPLVRNIVGPLTVWSGDFKKVTIYCFDSYDRCYHQMYYVGNDMPDIREQQAIAPGSGIPRVKVTRSVSAAYCFDMETGLTSVKVWGAKEAAAVALRVMDFK